MFIPKGSLDLETEKTVWLSLFTISYLVVVLLLVLDFGEVKQPYPEVSIIFVMLMLVSFLPLMAYFLLGAENIVLANHPKVKYFNPIGVFLGLFVALMLHVRQADTRFIYWVFVCSLVCSLSIIVMLSPVSVDMGSFYPLCGLFFWSLAERLATLGGHGLHWVLVVFFCGSVLIWRPGHFLPSLRGRGPSVMLRAFRDALTLLLLMLAVSHLICGYRYREV